MNNKLWLHLRAYWSSRLGECERRIGSGGPRARWLPTMEARVYRFLLALYADGGWSPSDRNDVDDRDGERDVVRSGLLVDQQASSGGAPPKSGARIRGVLKSLRGTNDMDRRPGPNVKGLGDDDWYAVGSFRQGWNAGQVIASLQLKSIPLAIVPVGRRHVVVRVPYAHRRSAEAVVADHAAYVAEEISVTRAGPRPAVRWRWRRTAPLRYRSPLISIVARDTGANERTVRDAFALAVGVGFWLLLTVLSLSLFNGRQVGQLAIVTGLVLLSWLTYRLLGRTASH